MRLRAVCARMDDGHCGWIGSVAGGGVIVRRALHGLWCLSRLECVNCLKHVFDDAGNWFTGGEDGVGGEAGGSEACRVE